MLREFIVAEVSKTYNRHDENRVKEVISQIFENLIEHNRLRQYRLHSFQFHTTVVNEDEINETIIAVFQRNRGMG